MSEDECLFCKIGQGHDPETRIVYQDEEFVAFKDIKPSTSHHYLVIPKEHIRDPKVLTDEHIPLVERLAAVGRKVLEENVGSSENARLGFHWPPFNSIKHLHLHVISQTNEMGFIAGGIFKPNTFWFVTLEWLLERIKKMKPANSN
ncbi:hypothetical protein SNE40_009849 [Patella caerulea]|uniref:Adenosine 5'-monophosphoramidase HINT3 n=1 Tax=Patella caerulea TaxID=87958 RepID=A0AAN8Q3S4_PATCE